MDRNTDTSQKELRSVAFIGLGIMGGPMAANLVRAGYRVTGYNRSRAAVDRLVEAGGHAASSVAEAVADAHAVITMLPADAEVTEVVLGEGGVLEHARSGSLFIDMSTISPRTATALGEAGREHGVGVLDAPVSGGEAGAVEGVLSIMAGGDAEDFERAAPLFDALGTTVVHVGPHGAGQTVKAANQLVVAVNIQALAEAVVFLEQAGADLPAALTVLGGGLAGSTVLNRKKETMLNRDFAPGFRIDLHHKDLGIVTDTAREIGAVLPAGALVAQLLSSCRANGEGGLDHSALLRGVERLSGRGSSHWNR
ncbi:2-hydroxy-3-oxopropionate reductase [Streptomyces justiciae]|uniref:2-hydroxy-3-oxopropionate reductase n=1 Tax=Streptomyces justiciae TaxID=2780140 RepID=A0ABU3M5G5_9ACTN|nr:2-hydroxy-3-oxopropionate reductase [Streptomyces justiciae]MDT7846747.1 2-hydroxy-3-oxopropionate reductase [Streptomyces justiciae]